MSVVDPNLPIAILAGGGPLPLTVARAARDRGHDVHIVCIEGEASSGVEAFSHQWVSWGQISGILQGLNRSGRRDMVIIGHVTRPDLAAIKFDFGALLNLPRLVKLVMAGGDDAVLSRVVGFFEEKGFRVHGAHQLAPELVAPAGVLTRPTPSRRDRGDIERGFEVVRRMGQFDIGQACVCARGHVIAVEAAEGTDRMLARCADLRQWGKRVGSKRLGVLIKAPKPRQELRVDMPVIGPITVQNACDAGLAGIAIEAGKVMIAERDETLALADREGLFIASHEGAAVSAAEAVQDLTA